MILTPFEGGQGQGIDVLPRILIDAAMDGVYSQKHREPHSEKLAELCFSRKRKPSSKVADQDPPKQRAPLPPAKKPNPKVADQDPPKQSAPMSPALPLPTAPLVEPLPDTAKHLLSHPPPDSALLDKEAEAPKPFELVKEPKALPSTECLLSLSNMLKTVSKASLLALTQTTNGWCISVDTKNSLWAWCRCPYGRVAVLEQKKNDEDSQKNAEMAKKNDKEDAKKNAEMAKKIADQKSKVEQEKLHLEKEKKKLKKEREDKK